MWIRESAPAEWHSWFDRWVIYADYDAEKARLSMEIIWVWDLVDRIAADDARRRAGHEPDEEDDSLENRDQAAGIQPHERGVASRPAG